MAFKFNPLSSQLDLIRPAPTPFDPSTIITHFLTPFGNPLMSYDPVAGVYYNQGFELVFDASGNVITS